MVTEDLNMSIASKREYLAKVYGRYQRAGRPHKSRILDEFCVNCGYHRKSALRLLGRPLGRGKRKRSGPKIICDPVVVLPVLKQVWLSSDQLCSKLLKAALPEWLEHHERRGAPLPEAVKKKLLAISPAQIDRLLQPARVRHPRKGLGATQPGTLLRRQVPTRGGPPDTSKPGWVESDTVAIAATPPRVITSIPSPLPSFSVAGRKTGPSGTRAVTRCWASSRNSKTKCLLR